MTSSIPNGFSTEDLQNLLESARTEEPTPSGDGPHGDNGMTDDELLEAAEQYVEDALQVCNDPLFHKVMALTIVARLTQWHKIIAEKDDNEKSAGAWMRDAGKLQAVMDIMTSLSVGPNDFTFNS